MIIMECSQNVLNSKRSCNIGQPKSARQTFDFIKKDKTVCICLRRHLEDTWIVIKSTRRILDSGGSGVVTACTPNYAMMTKEPLINVFLSAMCFHDVRTPRTPMLVSGLPFGGMLSSKYKVIFAHLYSYHSNINIYI